MKKLMMVFAVVFCLTASAGFADVTMLNSFEDVSFETVTNSTDTITLSNSTDSTEGTNSLLVQYDYEAQGAWFKNPAVSATYATPLDLSAMEVLRFDFKPLTAASEFSMSINFVDEKGYEARFMFWSPFGSTAEWETQSFPFSNLQKDMWLNQGRAANLKKIVRISFRILNGAAVGDGSLQFQLDNLRFESNVDVVNEILIEGFESYANQAALDGAWISAFSGGTPILNATNAYSGAQCLQLDVDLAERWTSYGSVFEFASAQDFSDAQYFKLAVFGNSALAGLSPYVRLYLEDVNGVRALANIIDWPAEEEWVEMYLPFQNQGILAFTDASWTLASFGYSCWQEDRWDAKDTFGWDQSTDLTQIKKIILTVMTNIEGSPGEITLYYDDVTLGLASDTPPAPAEPSVKTYTVNVLGAEDTAPTIDGTVNGAEWDLAASPGATGFVLHNDNTTAASEDPEVKALFDSGWLYILYQVTNADFSLDFDPSGQGRDPAGTGFGGDDFELFLAPGGNVASDYYHVVFFPYETDGVCYLWDEFGAGGPGTWDASIDSAAFNYDSGTNLLTIEYKIHWSSFDQSGAEVMTAPADGSQWGVQLGYINNNPAEAVNWEPSDTAGFASGRPFGTWIFSGEASPSTGFDEWRDYR